jgi:hypothetical protein
MSIDKRYVLCRHYEDGGILYVCGPDPVAARASLDVHEAMVFSSGEAAVAFRGCLPHQEGHFATQYLVHEWKGEGYVLPV